MTSYHSQKKKDSTFKARTRIRYRPIDKDEMIRWCTSFIACFVVYWMTKPDVEKLDWYGKKAMSRQKHEQDAHGMASNSSSASFGFWLKEGLEDEFTPTITWLMAWPDSGDEYLVKTLPHVTNHSMATNYGPEMTLEGKKFFSIPIYPRHSEGPYWWGLGAQEKVRPLPQKSVLTRTNCIDACVDCGPREYHTPTSKQFGLSCRNATARMGPSGLLQNFIYPIHRVRKAVHMIRNPFHNVIQRFFREIQRAKKRKDTAFLESYPPLPKKGFQKWCAMLDKKYLKETKKFFKDSSLVKIMEKTLCYAEFYKFMQWHNFAFEVTAGFDDTKVVYYEDFQTNFTATWSDLLRFVELAKAEKPYDFPPPHDYSRFYNEEHRERIAQLIQHLSSPKTREHMKRYIP